MTQQTEKCENCGQVIGKLESPMIWKGCDVCRDCYNRLSKSSPDPQPPMTTHRPTSLNKILRVVFVVLFGVCLLWTISAYYHRNELPYYSETIILRIGGAVLSISCFLATLVDRGV